MSLCIRRWKPRRKDSGEKSVGAGDGIEDGSRACAKDGYGGVRQVHEEVSINEEGEREGTKS